MRLKYGILFSLLVIGLLTFSPEAFAQSGGDITPVNNMLRTVTDFLQGTFARSIAIIAVIFVGLALLFNKMRWPWAAMIVAGIVVIFGAAEIVDFLI